jgi:hypothetical protein
MESVVVVLQVRVVATQTYPKTTVTIRATGRTLQRYIESARPASSTTLRTYTTLWDTILCAKHSVADLDNLCTAEADLLQSLDLTAEEWAILRQRHRSTQQVAANISILCE